MKKIYLSVLTVAFVFASAKAQNYCAGGRFIQEVFSAYNLTSDIVYGSNNSFNGAATTLKLDFYEPQGDPMTKRPLVVFAHGGSFIGGDKAQADTKPICEKLAKRGYTVASINYRVGMFPFDQTNATKAVLRAVQDMKASVRFFWKDARTANVYKIDTNFIFVGGSSAGAFMGLHYANLNKIYELAGIIDSATVVSMGGLQGNSGNPGYPTRVKGVINLCGALGKKQWMESGDVPTVSMHGTNDGTVPYGTATIYVSGFPIMVVDGSKSVKDRAQAVGVDNPFYTWYGAGHVPYASNAAFLDTTIAFVSNFLYKQLGCTLATECPMPNSIYDPASTPCALFQFTSVKNFNSAETFSIMPNPAKESISINFANQANRTLIVNDVSGRLLRKQSLMSSSYIMERDGLSSGIYFITIQNNSEGTLSTHKIIFE